MTTIDLPALDGRLPLGFLAACGVLRLLSSEDPESTCRLSWDPVTATARLGTAKDATLDDVVDRLWSIVDQVGPGALIPEGPVRFPALVEDRPRPDGMRAPRPLFRTDVETWRASFGDTFIDEWVPAMVTDQVVDGDTATRPPDLGDLASKDNSVASTPFVAPSGRQTFASMFGNELGHVKADKDTLRQALAAWIRMSGTSGEYLDHQVLNSAVDDPGGSSSERGVPGATWLALMALPLFPVHGRDGRAMAGGWRRVSGVSTLVWPLWEAPLDLAAVTALVTHPRSNVHVVNEELHATPMPELSVFRVCAARRRLVPDRKFAGVLTPVPVVQGP